MLVLGCNAMAGASDVTVTASDVFATINGRLGHMQAVASYKARENVPIEDFPREAQVLDNSVRSAAALGLAPKTVAAFYRAQIEAAKAIQRNYMNRWEQGLEQRLPADADLQQLRTSLSILGHEQVSLIVAYLQSGERFQAGQWQQFKTITHQAMLEEEFLREIFDALCAVELTTRFVIE